MLLLKTLIKNKYNFLNLYFIFFILFFTLWIKKEFGGHIHYIEIIYNFYINYRVLINSPDIIKYNFFLYVINLSIFFSILSFFILEKLKEKKIFKIKLQNKFLKNTFKIFFLDIKMYSLYSILFFLVSFKFHYFLLPYVNIFNNFDNDLHYKFNNDLYFKTEKINLKSPEKFKNLILIYFESLEYDIENLSNEINENPLKSLNQLPGKNIYNFKEMASAQISIAGIVASQCSVPFHPTISTNLNSFKLKKLFCLSDVLNQFEYDQYYFMTVNKEFQRTDYFKENHYYKIFDNKEIRKVYSDAKFGWGEGVHDNIMLDFAKKKILELHENKKRFNIVIKTTDTHPPYQKVSEICKIDNNMAIKKRSALSFKCISSFVSNFLDDLSLNGVLDGTTVVIMGDHLTHPNFDDKSIIKKSKNYRNIYFKMNTSNEYKRKKMNHFDVAPTILDELGFLDDHQKRFGFGVSLFQNSEFFDYNKHYNSVMSEKILNDFYLSKLLKN